VGAEDEGVAPFRTVLGEEAEEALDEGSGPKDEVVIVLNR